MCESSTGWLRDLLRAELPGACGVVSGDALVVGVSGGSDSMALLYGLAEVAGELGVSLTVAHLDHGLREESGADADFVRACCLERQVPCLVHGADVRAGAQRAGVSIEMAARQARHAWFREVVAHQQAVGVVVAHTADDQAETLLLNVSRGSGLHGLAGMQPRRELEGLVVLRPLLGVRREALRTYLRAHGVGWREDASNEDAVFLRNRVRHEVIPVLERINPRVVAHLAELAVRVSADDRCLDDLAAEVLSRCLCPDDTLELGGGLVAQPRSIQDRVLRLWCERVGRGVLTSGMTSRLWTLCLGEGAGERGAKRLSLEGGELVEAAYGKLRMVRGEGLEASLPLPVPGRVELPALGVCVTTHLAPGVVRDRGGVVGKIPARASIRYVPGCTLCLRIWRDGDRIRPFGLGGSRKVQDVFVDEKVPRACRDRIPLLVCGDDVVWIPGYCVAEGWEVVDPACESIQLEIVGKEQLDDGDSPDDLSLSHHIQ